MGLSAQFTVPRNVSAKIIFTNFNTCFPLLPSLPSHKFHQFLNCMCDLLIFLFYNVIILKQTNKKMVKNEREVGVVVIPCKVP